ncbi:hypothetical protein ACR6EC_23565, partial [Bacillus subtilis]|uniref:hypothetical protein n=1 Tax=Bacillus subtilis TaxID=1423 RepID=UPI003EB93751
IIYGHYPPVPGILPRRSGCGLPEDPGFLPPAQLKPGHIIYGHYPPVPGILPRRSGLNLLLNPKRRRNNTAFR